MTINSTATSVKKKDATVFLRCAMKYKIAMKITG